ncbi:MAG: glutathione S-transferase family protein [Desulfatiglans sp.]|jgi:glutathione S-transferase|nr:glutathione S-transferase family protein [Thermodesulfobacteriota bacterium]MEE4351374.1 glutathione S-transferase family protein [Desulfatiglans sp.]
MKLYYAPGTCAFAVHTALIWCGADYEIEKVKLGSDAYKKINPMGAVPALIDGDSGVMTQLTSLLKYLCRKYPDKNIGDLDGSKNEQALDQWLAFLGSDLHPAFGPFFSTKLFTTKHDEDSLNAIREAVEKRLDNIYRVLDQHLEGKDYIVGNKKSVADAYAYIITTWVGYTGLNLDDYPNVKRLFNKMAQDPGIIQAREEEGLR